MRSSFDGGSETNSDKVYDGIPVLDVLVDVDRERRPIMGSRNRSDWADSSWEGISTEGGGWNYGRVPSGVSSTSVGRDSGVECCWDSRGDRVWR